MPPTQTVTTDGTDLCVETFGDAADDTVLLIAGGAQSMIWWEHDFCARLAEAGRHVVRYDHRDTGRSTVSPAGRPWYTGKDLATDPIRLLDGLGIAAAHVMGLSMGGGIALYFALEHPDRVRTLCLCSTSPWVATQHALDLRRRLLRSRRRSRTPTPNPTGPTATQSSPTGSTSSGRTREASGSTSRASGASPPRRWTEPGTWLPR